MKLPKLQTIAELCMIAICILSFVILVRRGFPSHSAVGASMDSYNASLVGKTDSTVPASSWSGSDHNVVLLISSHCHFCMESTPLYQHLSQLHNRYSVTIGYADSPDGQTWTTYGNPIFTAGAAGAWDRPGVGDPSVYYDGTKFRMWYVGGREQIPGGTPDSDTWVEGSIGYALIP